MEFTSLNNSGLDVTHAQLSELFQPFVERSFDTADEPWRAELRRRESKIRRKYLKRRVLGWLPSTQRNERTVVNEYSKAWQPSEYEKYNLEQLLARVSPWEWGEQKLFASDVGATRFRQLILVRVIEQLKPRHVLEVGCGNGINLILLACRFPDIQFTGLELTQQGHQAAREFQQQAELPGPMRDYAPLELADPTAFRRIHFIQGSAAQLPFEDNSFDLVMTVLALEQMERIRDQALREITRVSARHLFNIEPFRDLNDRGVARRNVIRRNYFRGRIDDLQRYGFSPVLALKDFPQEAFLKVGAVLSKKEGT
jgi:SAM-dependent methyltransferase